MRVVWITFGAPSHTPDGALTSTIASLRYRVLAPIAEMAGEAWSHQVLPILAQTPEEERDAALRADVLIFSKSFLPANEALAAKAKALGIPVIFDVCDNHYQHPQYGQHYRTMSGLADQVACNTQEMARAAQPHCQAPPWVIEDPYEGVRGHAAFAPGERLKLLWFGHPTNLDSLQASLDDLVGYSARRPVLLSVLTEPSPALLQASDQLNSRFGSHFAMDIRPWSLEAQWRELAACDAVIIPSLQTDAKRVKSANRMVEGLWAGKPVVAQPMPAYAPFAAWTPIRETLSQGLDALAANPEGVPALVSQAQDHIANAYASAVLGRKWRGLIQTQCARRVAVR